MLFRQETGVTHSAKGKNQIPTIRQLNQEYAQVLGGKKATYAEYREARKQMLVLLIARMAVEAILEVDYTKMEQKKKGQIL